MQAGGDRRRARPRPRVRRVHRLRRLLPKHGAQSAPVARGLRRARHPSRRRRVLRVGLAVHARPQHGLHRPPQHRARPAAGVGVVARLLGAVRDEAPVRAADDELGHHAPRRLPPPHRHAPPPPDGRTPRRPAAPPRPQRGDEEPHLDDGTCRGDARGRGRRDAPRRPRRAAPRALRDPAEAAAFGALRCAGGGAERFPLAAVALPTSGELVQRDGRRDGADAARPRARGGVARGRGSARGQRRGEWQTWRIRSEEREVKARGGTCEGLCWTHSFRLAGAPQLCLVMGSTRTPRQPYKTVAQLGRCGAASPEEALRVRLHFNLAAGTIKTTHRMQDFRRHLPEQRTNCGFWPACAHVRLLLPKPCWSELPSNVSACGTSDESVNNFLEREAQLPESERNQLGGFHIEPEGPRPIKLANSSAKDRLCLTTWRGFRKPGSAAVFQRCPPKKGKKKKKGGAATTSNGRYGLGSRSRAVGSTQSG